jgi:hypothetical protein
MIPFVFWGFLNDSDESVCVGKTPPKPMLGPAATRAIGCGMVRCLAHSALPSELGLQGWAISSLITGVSQLRTRIIQMSTDAAVKELLVGDAARAFCANRV